MIIVVSLLKKKKKSKMKSMRKEITSRACPNSTCPKAWYDFGHLLLGYLPHSLLIYLLAIMYVSGSGVQDTQGPRFLPGAYSWPILVQLAL